jgi:hypothetical protein
MTPLMLSVLTFRAAHTNNVPYRHFSLVALGGALIDLERLKFIAFIGDPLNCDYRLTDYGRAFVQKLQTIPLP